MAKVYFSPSDQTRNAYAVGGANEAEQCRAIAQAAVTAARRCGLEAKTNVTAGGDSAMAQRVRESDAFGADLHVPIHTNAFNGTVGGTRMFCYDAAGKGYQACQAIMARLAPITPGSSDNITVHHFYEVTTPKAPTAYVEVAFHDNPTEAAWIVSHTREIAEAIVHGVCDYFGAAYVPAGEAQAPEPAGEPPKYYRVRRSWQDAKSQTGAFLNLDNAVSACPAGYTVYDWEGNAVYTPETARTVYTVRPGDTLWAVAKRYGLTVDALAKANGIADPSLIFAGQKIKIPG